MGIVENKLAEFELSDGTEYRLELNKSGRVHLHVDNVRVDLSPEELEHFIETVVEAKSELVQIKELE